MTDNQYSKHLEVITKRFEENFSSLSEAQLNWKPSSERWSIAQCMDHIIASNLTYFPAMNEVIDGKYSIGFWQKYSPFTKSIGKGMISSLGSEVKKKMKSPKIFLPSESGFSDILKKFRNHQSDLLTVLKKIEEKDPKEVIINSPVSKLITIPLFDAIQVILVHEERHLHQALRVKNSSGFPF